LIRSASDIQQFLKVFVHVHFNFFVNYFENENAVLPQLAQSHSISINAYKHPITVFINKPVVLQQHKCFDKIVIVSVRPVEFS
jgi:hypothetical protein